MGNLENASYFIAPAYLATFLVFAGMGFIVYRRLRVWSRRAQDEDHEEQATSE